MYLRILIASRFTTPLTIPTNQLLLHQFPIPILKRRQRRHNSPNPTPSHRHRRWQNRLQRIWIRHDLNTIRSPFLNPNIPLIFSPNIIILVLSFWSIKINQIPRLEKHENLVNQSNVPYQRLPHLGKCQTPTRIFSILRNNKIPVFFVDFRGSCNRTRIKKLFEWVSLYLVYIVPRKPT